ncbi:MAG: NHL repeat-containing protein [Opitutaceae bacterium]
MSPRLTFLQVSLILVASAFGSWEGRAESFTFTTLAGTNGQIGSTDGTGAAARFQYPRGIAVDSGGNIFVADTGSNTIRRITGAGVVTTFAGTAGTGGSANGTGSAASFFGPQGLAVNAAGTVYVTENSHTIRRITSAALVSTVAGLTSVPGPADGLFTAARFNIPSGVAADTAGNLYVADSLNHTIRKITPAGLVTTLAGAPGLPGIADGTGAAARFNTPSGLAVDASANIYVADFENHTIRKVTSAGIVTTLAGSPGTKGASNGTGSAARFTNPSGIAVDAAGKIYVADQGSHTIRAITSEGVVTVVAGAPGVPGVANGTGSTSRFYYPTDIAVDRAGNLYIAEAVSQTIRVGTLEASPPIADPATFSHISNLAIRSRAGAADKTLIVGFQIGGLGSSGAKPILLRAVGPTLAQFGVTGTLADPSLQLYSGATKIDQNDNWDGNSQIAALSAQVGAFALAGNTSKDAALFRPNFSAGSSSVWVVGGVGDTGIALAEVYDATPDNAFMATTPRLTNVSARSEVGTGNDMLFAGFTIAGTGFKTVLIRAVGPSLDIFGVTGTLANPRLDLFSGATKIFDNDDWGGDERMTSAFASVGAFALPAASRDAALLVTLAPGSYTVQVSGVGNTTGVALVEVYEVP